VMLDEVEDIGSQYRRPADGLTLGAIKPPVGWATSGHEAPGMLGRARFPSDRSQDKLPKKEA
jgi:hypothetical protein